MLLSLPAAKEPTIRHVLNKTAMVLYLSTDTITKSRVTYALASDVANCMMITRPHLVDPTGMVRNFCFYKSGPLASHSLPSLFLWPILPPSCVQLRASSSSSARLRMVCAKT